MLRSTYLRGAGWRWSVILAGMLLLAPASGAGARVIDRERYFETDSLEDTICGRDLHGEATFSGLFMLKTRGHQPIPYFFDNFRYRVVFTDDEGDGFIIQGNGLLKDLRIRRVEGTIYRFVAIETGQPFSIRALDGTVVLRDRGMLKTTFMVDTKGDMNLDNDEFIDGSFELLKDAGKHPGFYLEEEESCPFIEEAMGL